MKFLVILNGTFPRDFGNREPKSFVFMRAPRPGANVKEVLVFFSRKSVDIREVKIYNINVKRK